MSKHDILFFFFFQAEDGIRDFHVTGVQTCALPIFEGRLASLMEAFASYLGGPRQIIGNSKSWREALDLVSKVSPTETTVLLTGESGTGKEVVARAIHAASPRSGKPFLAINCAALPEQLLESELFGY